MQNTKIQWTDHTVNFWWGCTKVSRACQHCYAESVAKVFGKRLFGQVPQWGAGKPRFERLEAARKEALKIQRQAAGAWENWKAAVDAKAGYSGEMPRRPRVFVNSMSDWLDDEVPVEWLAFLLETVHLCPYVDFQLLTKRPENWDKRIGDIHHPQASVDTVRWLLHWFDGTSIPANLWIGCTAENQEQADRRIPHLLNIPARVRFLSCEPLLGAVDLLHRADGSRMNVFYADDTLAPSAIIGYEPRIHWIIAGGESGGQARPMHPDWVRSLRDQCAAAQVPFFFKQWGEWIPVNQLRHLESTAETQALPPHLARSYKGHRFDDDTLMLRVGSDHTGRLLDGVLHDAFPTVSE